MKVREQKLQKILDNLIDNKKVFGTSFAIKKGDYIWSGSAGNICGNETYFIASVTKLFTTALILHLESENRLHLEDKLNTYFSDEFLKGLHVFKRKDYSKDITILQLLSHTTGLPDYFQDSQKGQQSIEKGILSGNDKSWTFDEVITVAKNMNPLFAPGTSGKAHYSDVNFQLLGKIIEIVTGKTYDEICMELIIRPLHLEHTYLYKDPNDTTPKSLYYKSKQLNIPKAMTSFVADGGIVSTTSDMLVFTEAFFTGKLFPHRYIKTLQQWNKIFFPMKACIGIHKFELPWIFNPFGSIPCFLGHSGLSGALAFYNPDNDLFVVGTVNQVAYPDTSFKTLIKLVQIFLQK